MRVRYNTIFCLFLLFTACSASNVNKAKQIPTKLLTINGGQKREIIKNKICSPDITVCVDIIDDNGYLTSFIENKTHGTRTIDLEVWSSNLSSEKLIESDLKNIVLKGKEKKPLMNFEHLEKTKNYSYNFNFNSRQGDINAKHDDSYVYDLPFEVGKGYKVIQGYGGSFSHTNPENYFAYDFKMPPREIITAARDGLVIEIKENSNIGGNRPSLNKEANYLYLEHNDGTIGIYTHIKHNGVLVNLGDRVQKGQTIAISGKTGYLSSPHLHFSVAKFFEDGRIKSLPVKIKTNKGVLQKLENLVEYFKK